MEHQYRLFIAAPVPAALKHQLMHYQQHFASEAVRFVPEQNLHLTLFFIGNVPEQALHQVIDAAQAAAAQTKAFTLTLEKAEAGPNAKKPRLVWARFNPQPEYEALVKSLQQTLSPEPEGKQKLIPHITLARYRKNVPAPPTFAPVVPAEPVRYPVNEIAVWQSVLKQPHPEYSILQRFPLQL